MKIHNYGNDYAQSMKFQKGKDNAGNAGKLQTRKTGGEGVEGKKKEPEGSTQKPEEGAKEVAEKKEKAGIGKGKEKK